MLFKRILNIISNRSIWPRDGTLTGTTTPSQRDPGNYGNKRVISHSRELENLSLTELLLFSPLPYYVKLFIVNLFLCKK